MFSIGTISDMSLFKFSFILNQLKYVVLQLH